MTNKIPWWTLSDGEVAAELKTDLQKGLSQSEVEKRRKEKGFNELIEKKRESPLRMFFGQFNNLIVWVLLAAAFISGYLGEWIDTAAIAAIVILNAIIGFVQEFRAEKVLAALSKLSVPTCKVEREGKTKMIPARELIEGDVALLEAGDHVPADLRLVQASLFRTQEAALTGESVPVDKRVEALSSAGVGLGDRSNMCFMGTSVVFGKGRGVVTAIGMDTELGKIAELLQEADTGETPLQKRLAKLAQWLIFFCFGVVIVVFLLGLIRGEKLLDLFLTAVSLSVAAIPEGLPAIVTIALALGVQRMVQRHVLIRKLPSVETLGCAMVICSDKTGTLTQNQMTVKKVYILGHSLDVTGSGYSPDGKFLKDGKEIQEDLSGLILLLETATLCNGARLRREGAQWEVVGDPTEGAILSAALKLGLEKERLEQTMPALGEIPFDSERKMMSTLHQRNGKYFTFSKGAPDVIIKKCTHILENATERPITRKDIEKALEVNEAWAQEAMRVLAVAQKTLDENEKEKFIPEVVENGLTFLGLLAMIDPPRPEAKEAVEKCKKAGIRSVMITGDHKSTALAIARELGILDQQNLALSGSELDQISDQDLEMQVEQVSVYSRVSAEHKLRVVRAWRKRGKVVAMTGDGVNDAPAVKEADIGIAIGTTGTDVTKEASDMVITDGNFASIVSAVEEGRGIYENIKKSIYYLLSCNTSEILVMLIASLFGMPFPLYPVQILWINIATDGLPAIALGMDPIEKGIMESPPRSREEAIINRVFILKMLFQGFLMAFCVLAAFIFVLYFENANVSRARSVAFTALVLIQLVHAFNCRSEKTSMFKLSFLSNFKLIMATLLSFILQAAIIYLPFFRGIFKVECLSLFDWMLCLLVSFVPLVGVELYKIRIRKRIYG